MKKLAFLSLMVIALFMASCKNTGKNVETKPADSTIVNTVVDTTAVETVTDTTTTK